MTSNTGFRDWVKTQENADFLAEAGRYHLYVSLACPYAHRTLVVRELKGLQQAIFVTVVSYLAGSNGWEFTDDLPKCSLDTVNGCKTLKEVYLKVNPEYTGKFSVPMLFDKVKQTIVNNESLDICKMLNSEFNQFSATPEQAALDLYPAAWQEKIDEITARLATNVGVSAFLCGFTKNQAEYDRNVQMVFNSFDELDTLLTGQRYLIGQWHSPTLADVCEFVHLVRFDWVFHTLWKCDKKRVVDYPHLWAYCRDLYQTGTVADTVDKEHIRGVMKVALSINPNGIVSIGPTLNFLEPHGREHLTK